MSVPRLSRATWRSIGSVALIALVGLVWLWTETGDSGGTTADDGVRSTSSATATAVPTASPTATASPTRAATRSASPRPSSSSSPGARPTRVNGTDPASGLPWIAVQALPIQAREVLDDIDAGGPFAYPGKDGSTFGNFERVLPARSRGYYREYTVPTPGAATRGARRIVTGSAGEFFWTADHYAHFARIAR